MKDNSTFPGALKFIIVLFYINCAAAGLKFVQSIPQGMDPIPLLLCVVYFNTALNLSSLRSGWDDAALAILIAQVIARAAGMVWMWVDPSAFYWPMFGLPFLYPSSGVSIYLLGFMLLLAVIQIIILTRPSVRSLFHKGRRGVANQ